MDCEHARINYMGMASIQTEEQFRHLETTGTFPQIVPLEDRRGVCLDCGLEVAWPMREGRGT